MVDQSSLSWRLLVRKNGADLAFSQMIHAKNFVNDWRYRSHCIDWDNYTHTYGSEEVESEARRLDKNQIAQFAGDDPEYLVKAGKMIQDQVVAIDLNLGCPQKIARKGNYGAYLLPKTELVVSLLTAMVQELDVPITAKLRVLPTEYATLKMVEAVEKCGVQMITLHGRTAEASKLFTGPVNWDIIRKVKQSVSVPLIANGGISCKADVERCLDLTGADGVMSSEGLLENPKLFDDEGDALFIHQYVNAQLATVAEYISIVESFPYPRPFEAIVRGHLFKILYRFVDAPSNRDQREILATGSWEQMKGVVEVLRERLSYVDFDTQLAEEKGLLGPTTWYMRHRDERAANRVAATPKALVRLREEWKTAGTSGDFTTSDANYKDHRKVGLNITGDSVSEEDQLQSKIQGLKQKLKEKRQEKQAHT